MIRSAILILGCQLIFNNVVLSQTNTTWKNLDGTWSHPANWTNGVPDGSYNAYITGSTGTISQDMADLQLSGLTMDSPNLVLSLDESITINSELNFFGGTIIGDSNLTLAAGATGNFGSGGGFDGNLANGGGVLQLFGTANVIDSLNVNGFSELSGSGSVVGAGEFILNNAFVWNGGTMTDAGRTTINAGSLIHDGLLDRVVDNFGQSTITGLGLSGTANATWNNRGSDSFFKITGDQNLSGEGTFNNLENGLFKKTGGSISNIDWDFNHHGQMILVESGTMSFRGRTTIDGLMTVAEGATIDFQSNTVFGSAADQNGDGTMSFTGGLARFDHSFDGNFQTIVRNNASLVGEGDLSFHRELKITNGNLHGSGQLNLYGDSDFSIATIQRVVNNHSWANLENGLVSGAGDWNNVTGATLYLGGFNNAFVGSGRLTNDAGAKLIADGSHSWFDWDVGNSGEILAVDATISFRNDFQQTSGGSLRLDNATAEFNDHIVQLDGHLAGNGTIDTGENGLVVSGIIEPGQGIDQLHFVGDLQFTDDTLLKFEIGQDHQADFIHVTGDLILDGEVSISNLAGVSIGQYTLLAYDGQLLDFGLELTTLPKHLSGNLFHDPGKRAIGIQITSIPEPTNFGLFPLISSVCLRRRRR